MGLASFPKISLLGLSLLLSDPAIDLVPEFKNFRDSTRQRISLCFPDLSIPHEVEGSDLEKQNDALIIDGFQTNDTDIFLPEEKVLQGECLKIMRKASVFNSVAGDRKRLFWAVPDQIAVILERSGKWFKIKNFDGKMGWLHVSNTKKIDQTEFHDRQDGLFLQKRIAFLKSQKWDFDILQTSPFSQNKQYFESLENSLESSVSEELGMGVLSYYKSLLESLQGKEISTLAIKIRNRSAFSVLQKGDDVRQEVEQRFGLSWADLKKTKPLFETKGNIQFGKKMLSKSLKHYSVYKEVFDLMHGVYDIDPEVVVAIKALETHLGTIKLRENPFEVLMAQLAFLAPLPNDTPEAVERIDRIHKETVEDLSKLVVHCYEQDIDISKLGSNFLGAMGFSQFMPRNIPYIVNYDAEANVIQEGKKRINLQNHPDVILSTAQFLQLECGLSRIDWRKLVNIEQVLKDWQMFDARLSPAGFPSISGKNNYSFVQYMGEHDSEYAKKHNLEYLDSLVKKIMRYNFSSDYALKVLYTASLMHQKI